MNLEEILQQLIQANFRIELLMNSMLDVLEKKKLPDGTALITKEEVSARAEEIKKEVMEKARIAKPSLIMPPGLGQPPHAPKEG